MEAILTYLSELEANNNREFFHASKCKRDEANRAFEKLIQALICSIGQTDESISQNVASDLTFKLVRDTRFSADKSPYNPCMRAHIASKGKLPIPVGYFIAIRPGDRSFLGGGLFADMFTDATKMIRDYLAENGDTFERIVNAPEFTELFSVGGKKLKNVPHGYRPDHPQAEWLKYKSLYLEFPIADKTLLDENFVEYATQIFIAMKPFNDFLNCALKNFVMPTR